MACGEWVILEDANSNKEASYNIGRMIKDKGMVDAVVFILVGYDDSYGDFRDCMLWGSAEGGCI